MCSITENTARTIVTYHIMLFRPYVCPFIGPDITVCDAGRCCLGVVIGELRSLVAQWLGF